MRHLINDNSPASEGDYPDEVAAILLEHSTGWREAPPVPGNPADTEGA